MALRSAAGVGLNIAGVDFITRDISKSYREVGGAIIEINARPGLDIHIWPKIGATRDITSDILRLVFPSNSNGRIPIVSIAGDKGIGAPARYLEMILRGSGRSVAMALRNHSYLNGNHAELSASQQRKAVKVLLRDPEVETLLCTVSLRRVAKNGLCLDQCSLSILMDKFFEENTELFHKGLDVIKRATTHCFVVGAENHFVFNKLKSVRNKRLILVSDHFNSTRLKEHLANGHSAVTTNWSNGKVRILLLSGKGILASFDTDVVASRDGRLRKMRLAKSLMYAIAAAHGLGMSGPEITQVLTNAPSIIPDVKR
jgi:cyanophycin synthetase